MICKNCGIKYVKRHTCKAGVCDLCGKLYKNLVQHKCPIKRFMDFDYTVFKTDNSTSCFGCLRKFYTKLIYYNGAILCRNCVNVHEIQCEIKHTKFLLNLHHVNNNKNTCDICGIIIINKNTLETIIRFDADHINPFNKKFNICDMIVNGSSNISEIIAEIEKCRLLCTSCHSFVTHIQLKSGLMQILKIKDYLKEDEKINIIKKLNYIYKQF